MWKEKHEKFQSPSKYKVLLTDGNENFMALFN